MGKQLASPSFQLVVLGVALSMLCLNDRLIRSMTPLQITVDVAVLVLDALAHFFIGPRCAARTAILCIFVGLGMQLAVDIAVHSPAELETLLAGFAQADPGTVLLYLFVGAWLGSRPEGHIPPTLNLLTFYASEALILGDIFVLVARTATSMAGAWWVLQRVVDMLLNPKLHYIALPFCAGYHLASQRPAASRGGWHPRLRGYTHLV